jgi:hypothetical protein
VRLREQLQHRRRDDAERPLRPDEEVFQVVARVVLAQALEPVPHPAVGEHHLEAQHEIAGVAVAQDAGAAGVGPEVAADAAGSLRRQGEGEGEVGGIGGVVDALQDAARLDRDGGVDGVELAHPVKALGREHDAAERARPRRRARCCRCGPTRGTPARLHSAATAETSSVVRGRTSARA